MRKKIILIVLAIGILLVIVALLGGTKFLQISAMIEAGGQPLPATTVSAAEVSPATWETTIPAVGSVTAINGITVSTEVSGTVSEIAFEAGAEVQAGDLLVRLEDSVEQANLARAQSELDLARKNLMRTEELFARNSVPRSELDAAEANLASARASVSAEKALLDKKRILAPFAGRLGIRQVSLGEYLSPGDAIVGLQSISPIFVEFSLPQEELSRLSDGQEVRIRSSTMPGKTLSGRLTAIDAAIDPATRNVTVQATFGNAEAHLRPGMFVNAEVVLPGARDVVVVPQTSVIYNAYGDSVFLVRENEQGGLTAEQIFVRLGQRRGDFVELLSGLEPGQQVVQAGAFKLSNRDPIVLSDEATAEPKLHPTPENR